MDKEVENMFDSFKNKKIAKYHKRWLSRFVIQYRKKGQLSEKQMELLKNIYKIYQNQVICYKCNQGIGGNKFYENVETKKRLCPDCMIKLINETKDKEELKKFKISKK
ncbi:MAG: hypothetical protein PHW96_02480 [Candidatus Nanoarchaeia archaeon]|nr:hypothetical protein [Candidatus Nanoarchaeia archaeon]